jgi:hypothetical protein
VLSRHSTSFQHPTDLSIAAEVRARAALVIEQTGGTVPVASCQPKQLVGRRPPDGVEVAAVEVVDDLVLAAEHHPAVTRDTQVVPPRPGGIGSHVFDHRDHLYHADHELPFLSHLALPELAYRALLGGPLTYHNRLAPAAVCRMFEEVGFERIALRRLVLPERRYRDEGEPMNGARAGLPRRLLAPAWREISEDDLRTAAAHYVFVAPPIRTTIRGP